MSLVSSDLLLRRAQAEHYAIGAFNAENMEMVMAIVEAATEMEAPVIIQTTPSTLKYATPKMYQSMVKAVADLAPVPVVMHLDHGNSVDLAFRSIEAGYTSVMIDGSPLPFEENIAMTQKVVEYAKTLNIPVEAELGKVGGKEDDLVGEGGCTDPEEAAEFALRTQVNSLAIAIGTAHGVYKKEPKLDVQRLKEIRLKIDTPLVLHGASGLSDAAVQECIAEGICKVNFATELRVAYTQAVRAFLGNDSEAFDPKKYGKDGMAAVKKLVMNKMAVCGCAGKAR